ncbi:hypothetical protein [Klebsiella pneumoniae]|uniref:hypothetical protein n=1 Tax=Klebsiella pneumoniae TaxID=573 RepID=UPI0015F34DB5|nr:hypothetical protein [Klebsiella pneumoniae]
MADIKKTKQLTVRVNPVQEEALQKMVDSGEHKSIAAAIQYLINKHTALNSK